MINIIFTKAELTKLFDKNGMIILYNKPKNKMFGCLLSPLFVGKPNFLKQCTDTDQQYEHINNVIALYKVRGRGNRNKWEVAALHDCIAKSKEKVLLNNDYPDPKYKAEIEKRIEIVVNTIREHETLDKLIKIEEKKADIDNDF